MVATTEALDSLKSIGLNLYERKIYVALLAKGVATAAQVSEIATVPRSRSYDVLESLAERGFVVLQPSKPIKYFALKPSEALERTKDALLIKANTMIERIDRLKVSPVLTELESIYKEGMNLIDPTEMTGTLKGSRIIHRQLGSLFKDAKKNINILTTEKGLEDIHSNHFKTLRKLSRKGVKIRIAAPSSGSKAAKQLASIADFKDMRKPLGRLAMVDGENLLMSLTEESVHESQDIALWANSGHAIKSLASPLFNQVWKGSN